MSRVGRSLFWWVVLGWVGVWPLLGTYTGVLWEAHVGAVILAAVCAACALWKGPRVRIGAPFLATLAALISLVAAMNANRTDFAVEGMRSMAVVGAAHALFFLACLGMAPDRDAPDEHRSATRRALIAVLAVLALGQVAFMIVGAGSAEASGRPSGTLGNPNALGALLGATALALAAFAGGRGRAVTICVALGLAVLATRSRGAVLATGLVGFVFLWRRVGWKALALAAGGVVLLLVIPNPLSERAFALQTSHVYSRPFLWSTAASIGLEHPFGLGPGNYGSVFPAHALDPDFPWLLHQRHAVGLTHNVFLTLGVEWGWAALAAVLALTAWATARFWPRRPGDPLRQGALLGAAVLFVEMQVDGTEQNRVVFSVFLLLLAVALARVTRPQAGWRVSGRWAAVGALAAAAWLGGEWAHYRQGQAAVLAIDAVMAAHGQGRADDAAVRDAFDALGERALSDPRLTSRRVQFEESVVRALLEAHRPAELMAAPAAGPDRVAEDARMLVDRARWTLALGKLEWAELIAFRPRYEHVEWRRRSAHLHRLLARRLAAFPGADDQRARSIDRLDGLLAVDPLDVESRLLLAQWAHEDGDPASRDAHFAALVAIEPDHAWAWFWAARLADAEGRLEDALYAYVRAEEAVGNARLKARVDSPRSRRFFERSLERVDLARIREGVVRLRRTVYF